MAVGWHSVCVRALGLCAVVAAVAFSILSPAFAETKAAPVADASSGDPSLLTPEKASALWQEMAATLGQTVAKSQRILLGTRNPNGPSCVTTGWGHNKVILNNGGPGSRIGVLYLGSPARNSPKADYKWYQTSLKPALEAMRTDNREALAEAVRLADQAKDLWQALSAWTNLPQGFADADVPERTHWVGYCAHALDDAIGQRDLAGCRKWAGELASAAFAMADLHRWLDFLLTNQLEALAFQARCEPLFDACEEALAGRYRCDENASSFPAGRLIVRGLDNYLEVERQAERLMRVPPEHLVERPDGITDVKADEVQAVPAALWIPPSRRGVFVSLRSRLSRANRDTWDQAAHSPFDRSYLVNMLFRITEAKTLDALAVTLERFDKAKPRASQPALMGAICYRGDDSGGDSAWGDRFDPRLMKAAATLTGSDEDVLLGAQRFTRGLIDGPQNYGPVDSISQALAKKTLNCLVATDVVASLYRNAGRSGFFSVRWCAGTAGHTVAAAEVLRCGNPVIVLADGLGDPQTRTERWPDAYLQGHPWPSGYAGAKPDLYAVELYGRGIDNCVWLEGYIVKGPDAGLLVRTGIPYMPHHAKPAAMKASAGEGSNRTTLKRG